MSKIPEPQRSEIIWKLSKAFGYCELVLDGEKVSFQVQLYKPLMYVIRPFINGYFRGGWLLEDTGTEIPDKVLARRVLRSRTTPMWDQKTLKSLNRGRRAAGFKPITKEQNRRRWLDIWHCPKSLVRHLEKQFDSIEIGGSDDA